MKLTSLLQLKLKHNFVETPSKFIIAKLSIRKLGSSSVLIIMHYYYCSTDEDPSLRIESFAKINLRGVSTKLYFNLIFTMQTCKELIIATCGQVAKINKSVGLMAVNQS